MSRQPLQRDFYLQDVVQVARQLLGKKLIRETEKGITSGRIVETEAYKSKRDPACHASRGKTQRNATMFGPAGHAYVYAIHARFCFNVVTQPEGEPSAVLVRAVEPMEGVALMQQRRDREKLLDLTRGPARLCEAFALDKDQDKLDLTSGQGLWITAADMPRVKRAEIGRSPRIGVTSAEKLKLRFFLRNNPFVSGPKHLLAT